MIKICPRILRIKQINAGFLLLIIEYKKCLAFSKAFFYGFFRVIKNRYKPVSSVKHVGQKKTLPFAKSKKCSVFKCNNLMNVSGNYAISVSREDFIDELIIDKVRGSDSPEKKASNTS